MTRADLLIENLALRHQLAVLWGPKTRRATLFAFLAAHRRATLRGNEFGATDRRKDRATSGYLGSDGVLGPHTYSPSYLEARRGHPATLNRPPGGAADLASKST